MRTEFLDFYEHERPLVERFLMILGASRQDAEDGAHEAFVEAWRKVDQGTWQWIDNKRAWVRTVACRAFSRPPRQRRSARTVPTEPADLPSLADVVPDHAELTVQTLAVLHSLSQLNDTDACAVIALDYDEFTGAEIAAILAIDEQRVRDLRKKARKHLKRNLFVKTSVEKEEQSR